LAPGLRLISRQRLPLIKLFLAGPDDWLAVEGARIDLSQFRDATAGRLCWIMLVLWFFRPFRGRWTAAGWSPQAGGGGGSG
jgi:hypothetical protein